MKSLRELNAFVEHSVRFNDFIAYVRCLAMASGDRLYASRIASERGLPEISRMLKAAVTALTSDPTSSSVIAGYPVLITAFLESLRNVSAFDAIMAAGGFRRAPLKTKTAAITIGATAFIRREGQVKPMTQLALATGQLDPVAAVAIVAISQEVLRSPSADAAALLGRELKAAVGTVTDQEFIDIVTTGLTPIASSGTTVAATRQDLARALSQIDTSAASRLFVLVEPATAKAWALSNLESGQSSWPGMTPTGGMISGMTCLVCDGVVGGTIVVLDAAQIAAGNETIVLEASSTADLQFEAAPDSPSSASTVLRSLWQSNLTAIKAERYFGCERLGAASVALISGVAYGGSSPA